MFCSHARLCCRTQQRLQRVLWHWGSVILLHLNLFHAAFAGVMNELVKLGTVEGVRHCVCSNADGGKTSVRSSL